MIKAEIVAHSVNPLGDEIATMKVTFPRFILAEMNTHRVFSRNSASSRAIPFKEMVKMVQKNPFIPYAWQIDHKGMQGTKYLDDRKDINLMKAQWLEARDNAVKTASELNEGISEYIGMVHKNGIAIKEGTQITKQLCNRLLEPFMWHTALITSTEWENFFQLRCPQYEPFETDSPLANKKFRSISDINCLLSKDYVPGKGTPSLDLPIIERLKINTGQAEIHMMFTAEAMYDALKQSKPRELKAGEWHIPYGDNINFESKEWDNLCEKYYPGIDDWETVQPLLINIATARAARVSYNNFEGDSSNYIKDVELHDKLLRSGHWSPFEHCAKAMGQEDYDNYIVIEDGRTISGICRNFKGFVQYRSLIEK